MQASVRYLKPSRTGGCTRGYRGAGSRPVGRLPHQAEAEEEALSILRSRCPAVQCHKSTVSQVSAKR